MFRLRTASGWRRTWWAALLALVFALRLLTPAGFMPAFDHGSVSIIVCPDGDSAPGPMAHHHHGSHKLQQHCPYAAGASPATAADLSLIVATLLAVAALLAGRPFESFHRTRLRDRPPLRGPPFPA